jgi:2'-5' RNA ligase
MSRFSHHLRHPKPPGRILAVVWLPNWSRDHPVERVRAQHDPQAQFAPAHVHLVFPFTSSLTALQLAAHVKRVVQQWPVIPATFRFPELLLNEYILLPAQQGNAALIALHDALYRGVLVSYLRADIEYRPHITVGRLAQLHRPGLSADEHAARAGRADEVLQEAELCLRDESNAVLRELAVVEYVQPSNAAAASVLKAKMVVKFKIPMNWG